MKKITGIAWRNLRRNPLRSGVVIFSIFLGIWAGVFIMGLSFGITHQRQEATLATQVSFIQIHEPDFPLEKAIKDTIPDPQAVVQKVKAHPEVTAVSPRSKITAMASTAGGARGVTILGIRPDEEKTVSDLYTHIDTGSYFDATWNNQILIGQKLAEKLKVHVRNKVVLNFQDTEGDLVAAAFRIVGIFDVVDTRYEESTVFVRQSDLGRLLGSVPIHEIAINTATLEQSGPMRDALQKQFPGLKVEDWGQIAPQLAFADAMMSQVLYIIVGIVILALMFGILNTMLMAILERRRELGILKAIGMNRTKIFGMIMIETLFFAVIGGLLGLVAARLTIGHFGRAGIDLSMVSEGMEGFGLSSVIEPRLGGIYYVIVFGMVFGGALLSAIYPAITALKLNPAQALHFAK